MQTPGNQRLPWILVTLLVALNVVVLAMVWFRPPQCPPSFGPPPFPPHGRPQGGPHGLAGEIGLKDEQMDKFLALQGPHFERMDGYRDRMISLRVEAFKDFGKAGMDSAAVGATFEEIGHIQVQAEMDRFKHFQDVLAICTPEQAAHFLEVLPRILSRPGQPENRPGGPGAPHGPARPDGPREPHGHPDGPPQD